MSRRSFLTLPAIVPLAAFHSALKSGEHHFQHEYVVGTSLDLVIWTPDPIVANDAHQIVLEEIHRLTAILNSRDPNSEISMSGESAGRRPSHDLEQVLAAYAYWEHRTDGVFSIRPGGANTPRNIDALGKAYILDRSAEAVRKATSAIDAFLLNIGGDIVLWGRSREISIADPSASYDNAGPVARIELHNAAVATSGTYARGAHLLNPANGQPLMTAAAATVVASDAVTANALATTLCLTDAERGLRLVESTAGAEALRIAPGGAMRRTSGFGRMERPPLHQASTPTPWPRGYQVTVTLTLTAGRSKKRPYVAVWVENSSGRLLRLLAFWGNKSKYFSDLSTIWSLAGRKQDRIHSVTRATRPAGKYELVWDGLDDQRMPVPPDTYRIVIETNQEGGTYAKQAGSISIGDSPASITLPATANFEAVQVQYGPKQNP